MALNGAETLTRLPDHHVEREADFRALQQHFDDKQIVEPGWAIAVNAWNRTAIGMHMPVDSQSIE